ncbi:hypothetical protein GR254_19315 [Mycobacterium tuberculosis]|nr:hypothetical protein [Mycobacterium tuberculosis]
MLRRGCAGNTDRRGIMTPMADLTRRALLRWVSWALRSWVSSCMTSSRVCVRTASCSVRCCSNRFHCDAAC